MAVLSKFDGIVILMVSAYPFAPRFHAIYGASELIVQISPLLVVTGDAPIHIRDKVMKWAENHQEELLEAWSRCRTAKRPAAIAPSL